MDEVLELDADGDAGVRRVLTDAGRTVGRAVADLANSLNPELVVVGGSLGAAPSLLTGLRDSIDRYAQPDTAAALRGGRGRARRPGRGGRRRGARHRHGAAA